MIHLTVESVYGGREIDVLCPKCESITKITFRNLLHTPYRFKCKECRNNININHLENFKPQLEILEKQLIEIEQSLNNIDIAKMINLTKIN